MAQKFYIGDTVYKKNNLSVSGVVVNSYDEPYLTYLNRKVYEVIFDNSAEIERCSEKNLISKELIDKSVGLLNKL